MCKPGDEHEVHAAPLSLAAAHQSNMTNRLQTTGFRKNETRPRRLTCRPLQLALSRPQIQRQHRGKEPEKGLFMQLLLLVEGYSMLTENSSMKIVIEMLTNMGKVAHKCLKMNATALWI